jgi:uncharacterized protein YceK
MRRIVIAAAIASSVSACASVTQAVSAYGSAALTGAKAANDTLIEANKAAMCATPVSALVRHPELVPAVKSLCGAGELLK